MRKKIVSLVLALSLVLPMIVGLTHAVHEHDQQVCLAETESHIHSQGIDCDHQHYFNPGGVFEHGAPDKKLISKVEPLSSWGETSRKSIHFVSHLSLRGPPSINV